MDRARQVAETRWLTEINARYGFPGAIVAHAWFHTENAEEILAAQSQFPLVRGIRSKPVTSLSPGTATPGAPGTMPGREMAARLLHLEKYGLSWDLRVPYWHLAEAAEVARQFPRTQIILNHTGFPWDRSDEGLAAWRRGMEAVAREPNVHVKVSEFGLKDSVWSYGSNRRVVLDAIAIFGIGRCVFASNFPVAGLRIDYDTLVRSLSRMLAGYSGSRSRRLFLEECRVVLSSPSRKEADRSGRQKSVARPSPASSRPAVLRRLQSGTGRPTEWIELQTNCRPAAPVKSASISTASGPPLMKSGCSPVRSPTRASDRPPARPSGCGLARRDGRARSRDRLARSSADGGRRGCV